MQVAYKIDIKVDVYANLAGRKYAKLDIVIKDKIGFAVDCKQIKVYEPNWFGTKILGRTFEGEIKKRVTQLMEEAKGQIEKEENLTQARKVVGEIVDGILNRTP